MPAVSSSFQLLVMPNHPRAEPRESKVFPLGTKITKICASNPPPQVEKKKWEGLTDTYLYLLSLALALSIHNKVKKA
jgi:hypothetical protein